MKKFSDYFKISELVCPHVLKKYREEQMWSFFDIRLLETMLVLRKDIIQRPMMINGQIFTQRGLRCNCCDLVKSKSTPYLSAHLLGKGIDFSVPGLSAEAVRKLIDDNKAKLPYPIRLESDVTWVHLDVCNVSDKKIIYFKG